MPILQSYARFTKTKLKNVYKLLFDCGERVIWITFGIRNAVWMSPIFTQKASHHVRRHRCIQTDTLKMTTKRDEINESLRSNKIQSKQGERDHTREHILFHFLVRFFLLLLLLSPNDQISVHEDKSKQQQNIWEHT